MMNPEQAIVLQKEKSIIDMATGEVMPMATATESQISGFLSKVNHYLKQYKNVDKMVKDWIKTKYFEQSKLDDNGVMFVGQHRVKQYYRTVFDKSRFAKEATEEEKKIMENYESLKDKYVMRNQTIKIGG